MTPDSEAVSRAMAKLRVLGDRQDTEIHESFLVELDNYSRHSVVRDLPPDRLEDLLVQLGQRAMRAGGRTVGGGTVRKTLMDLCPDAFSDCSGAVDALLGLKMGGEAEEDSTS